MENSIINRDQSEASSNFETLPIKSMQKKREK